MKPLYLALVAVVGMVGAAMLAGNARARQLAADAPDNTQAEDAQDPAPDDDDTGSVTDAVNPWALIEGNTMSSNAADPNVAAFLAAIRYSEGTDRQGDPYRVCYGYTHTIGDLSDHPAITGEWAGVPLDNLGPRYAGLKSTAAGAYQFIRPTWLAAKKALHLSDFGAESQDAAAVWLIDRRGALDDVRAGRLDDAAAKCAAEWASLPGSTAGQGGRSRDQLAAAFINNGGTLA